MSPPSESDWTVSIDDLDGALRQPRSGLAGGARGSAPICAAVVRAEAGRRAASKVTRPDAWKVAGVTRDAARMW